MLKSTHAYADLGFVGAAIEAATAFDLNGPPDPLTCAVGREAHKDCLLLRDAPRWARDADFRNDYQRIGSVYAIQNDDHSVRNDPCGGDRCEPNPNN